MCHDDCTNPNRFEVVSAHEYFRVADPALGLTGNWSNLSALTCGKHLAGRVAGMLDVSNLPSVYSHVRGPVGTRVVQVGRNISEPRPRFGPPEINLRDLMKDFPRP